MNTSVIILALILIVCFLLVVVIMVQNPKGGGLSSSFGGGGGQQMGGVKKTGDFLDKSTWTLATALLVLILLYNVTSLKGSGRVESRLMDGTTPVSVPSSDQSTQQQDDEADFNAIQNQQEEETAE